MAFTFRYELILALFLLVMVYLTFVSYRRKQITRMGFIFWSIIWLGGIVSVLFHPYLSPILTSLVIMRVFDLYTIAGFFILFFIIFYLFRAVQRTERRMELVTRTIALKPLKQASKSRI